jgi:hypothetical protein
MGAAQILDDTFSVSIPKNLVDSAYVQKFLRYLEFEKLVKGSTLTEEQAFELSEELKKNWWKENKDWFLDGIKQ